MRHCGTGPADGGFIGCTGKRLISVPLLIVQTGIALLNVGNALIIAPFFLPDSWKLESTMANTASARKAARQSETRRVHNASLRSELRSAIKRVKKAIEAGDKVAARTVLSASSKIVDSIADKNIIHKNKAARHKSRLSAAIKAMA